MLQSAISKTPTQEPTMGVYQKPKSAGKSSAYVSLRDQIPWLFPIIQLLEDAKQTVHESFDQLKQKLFELVLEASAENLAGVKTPGAQKGPIRWYGSQPGVIALEDRRLRLSKPRLRHKDNGEVAIPAYAILQENQELGAQLLNTLMRGVSTRQYEEVLPAMAEQVGISRSSLSRRVIDASEEALETLQKRRFDDHDILVIYLDGIVVGGHPLLAAVGVDRLGNKHVLGLKECAQENATAAQGLLEDLVERGIKPEVQRLFVIDGSKALRKAIRTIFGSDQLVQRCRLHKERNVLEYLPVEMRESARARIRAAWKLEARQGMAALEALAQSWEKKHPSAAASLREGLEEMFTINRLGLPEQLCRGLSSTNAIESTFSGTRCRIRRVTRWQGGAMALRWAAAALLITEKHYRRLMGYCHLHLLEAALKKRKVVINLQKKTSMRRKAC
jgi:transposase-like protein